MRLFSHNANGAVPPTIPPTKPNAVRVTAFFIFSFDENSGESKSYYSFDTLPENSLGATVPPIAAPSGAGGYIQQKSIVAAIAPSTCATIKLGASDGRIPAKVLLAARASVTAGFAKDVDEVNQ
jgi:hypothetical protein